MEQDYIMTFGEHLLNESSLFSGNTARDHFLDISKPDTIYADGEKTVYLKHYDGVNSGVELSNVNGQISISRPRGRIINDQVNGKIEIPEITGE